MDQIGAVAGKQYQGDGLSVAATPEGARLRCVFQRLEGEATPEGCGSPPPRKPPSERFRVVAVAVGRRDAADPTSNTQHRTSNVRLEAAGSVAVDGQTVRFIRPGLTEEYTVSMDGVRQDFVVLERPAGAGQLRVELDVAGARPSRWWTARGWCWTVPGGRLPTAGCGRRMPGKELAARMEVASGNRLTWRRASCRPDAGAEWVRLIADEATSAGLKAVYGWRGCLRYELPWWTMRRRLSGAD